MVKPLTRLVGLPARRSGGVAGDLASANSVRNPSRTASTAAALMIGLTLVTVVAVLGAGLRSTVESAVTDQVNGRLHPRRHRRRAVRGRRGRRARARARREHRLARPRRQGARGRQGAGRHRRRPGDDRALLHASTGPTAPTRPSPSSATDGALVTQTYADDQDLAVGDRLSIQTASGDKLTVVVRGIYDPPEIEQMLGPITHRPAGVRQGVPAAQEPVHVPRRRSGRQPGADRGGGRLQRRRRCTPAPRSRTTTRRASPAS